MSVQLKETSCLHETLNGLPLGFGSVVIVGDCQ